jgi:hypothetical protein
MTARDNANEQNLDLFGQKTDLQLMTVFSKITTNSFCEFVFNFFKEVFETLNTYQRLLTQAVTRTMTLLIETTIWLNTLIMFSIKSTGYYAALINLLSFVGMTY